jgi:hypothetical protein
MEVECDLDVARYPVKHYTHIHVDLEDYPWVAEEMAAQREREGGGGKKAVEEAPVGNDEGFVESSDSEMEEDGAEGEEDGDGDTEDHEDAMEI